MVEVESSSVEIEGKMGHKDFSSTLSVLLSTLMVLNHKNFGTSILALFQGLMEAFVFSEKKSIKWLRHISFWLLVLIFQGVIYSTKFDSIGEGFLISFVEAIFYLPIHLFLTYSIIYFLIPRFLVRGKYGWLTFGVLLCLLVTSLITIPITNYIVLPFHVDHAMMFQPKNSLFYGLMAGFRGSLTISGFAVAIKLTKLWIRKKQETELSEKERLMAELNFLKGQLHPHFIFNTLSSIYYLSTKQSEKTPLSILKLSNILRFSLNHSDRIFINLEEELALIQDYIDLQKYRYGDAMHVYMDIEGKVEGLRIPALLLIPIIENAFKYGADEIGTDNWIGISGTVCEGTLELKVINSIAIKEKPTSMGIGLANVQKRLALLYPEQYSLETIHDEREFIVNLKINLSHEFQ
ncbi:sensor histidine kinase [Pararhodonellum marinum]|uniref:sensor histidine kinase n=1 Tax=Pararhodonellum marinum TaxID=2755358 RepID=UPI001890600C|nr:histidine kinase [Pararhodonellum marinum]